MSEKWEWFHHPSAFLLRLAMCFFPLKPNLPFSLQHPMFQNALGRACSPAAQISIQVQKASSFFMFLRWVFNIFPISSFYFSQFWCLLSTFSCPICIGNDFFFFFSISFIWVSKFLTWVSYWFSQWYFVGYIWFLLSCISCARLNQNDFQLRKKYGLLLMVLLEFYMEWVEWWMCVSLMLIKLFFIFWHE